ncbi:hypothetical protein [Paenibacillus sp. TY11]|uniref:hypothetical protein n=1 Tax=Paenibacillus sp. TY11 TaxID=3448633 RepID=UPI00403A11D1
MIDISLNSVVDAHHLTIQGDGEEYTVGDPNQSIFIRIPVEGKNAIELMDGKSSLNEIQEKLQRNGNIEVDLVDFVQTLVELNLIHKIDNQVLVEITEHQKISEYKKKLGMIFFNRITYLIYSVSFIISLILILLHPNLVPHYKDYFIFENSVGLSLLVLFVISWLLTIIHESGHYLSASALGVPVNFKINIRWFWMVIEANMNALWSVDKRKRFVPFLAGMAWDSVILLLAILVQIYYYNVEFVVDLSRLVVLLQIYKFLWHLLIFFKTDLYYVLITVTNSSNLLSHAILYLKILIGFKKKTDPYWSNLSVKEQRISKLFSAIYVSGIVSAIVLFSFYSVPGFFMASSSAFTSINVNHWSSLKFWDGMIVILITAFNLFLWSLGALNWLKARKNNVGVGV